MRKLFLFISIFILFALFNQVGAAKALAAADLIPTDFQLTDATGRAKNSFKVGEQIFVKVTISNSGTTTGDSSAGQTLEAFYRNVQSASSIACNTTPDPAGLYLVNGLFGPGSSYSYGSYPGGTKQSLFTNLTSWTMTTPGSYRAVAFVDYDCKVAESSENNNQISFSYTITSDTPLTTPTNLPISQSPTSGITPQPTQIVQQLTGSPLQVATGTVPEGAWVIDPEVTRIGKNASRSGMLLDWTLQDYQWASSSAQQVSNSPLAAFWLIIQRIVYSLFLVVILITAFVLIVTRGRSLSAKRFLPRFFLAVLLVTFSFSMIQFIYQFTDIIQGFFLKNPQGGIISSKDLLYIGFNYSDFQGLRRIGLPFEESAFVSLILVKFTSFTYYVMALLLLFRKILLWFFIILSPVFPILLLFYPVRNTGKIWIGEFFRWVMYAPLFAIFLSGLVKLWQSGLPLIFDFSGVSKQDSIYPTAVNILLGGPGQRIGINNSVNLPDTFALYVVALIMLWAVILLPFILLQIFLDHMLSFNYQESPMVKQMLNVMNNRLVPPPKPLGPVTPVGPLKSAGLARSLPYGKNFAIPKTTGLTKDIPTTASRQQTIQRPISNRISNQSVISHLTNLSIPTMRDIARYETTKLASDVRTVQETSRVSEILHGIANPTSTSSITERDRFRMIREQLVTEGQKGNQVATTILNAANTYNSYAGSQNSVENKTSQLIQQISNPTTITNQVQREKVIEIKNQLIQAAKSGNELAQTFINSVTNITNKQINQLQSVLQKLNHTTTNTSPQEKQVYQSLREKIVASSKSGNTLATILLSSMEKSTSIESVKELHEKLIEAQNQGSPLAKEVLEKVTQNTKLDTKETAQLQSRLEEAKKKGDPLATVLLQAFSATQSTTQSPVTAQSKLKTGNFPVVNRIQQVSIDDYESVKKMWKENYQNLEVPQSLEGHRSRREWITGDINEIQQTISLLTSTDVQKVEEGMQKVSDILPFLLIGGFSQTEIIAYLKAKSEAGKATLEELGKKEEEQEVYLEAEQAARKATGQMTMQASIEQPVTNTFSRDDSRPIMTNNVQTLTREESASASASQAATSSQNSSSLLKLVQLPILTMRDIVRLESPVVKHASTQQEVGEKEKIATILTKLADPASSAPQERERYARLHEDLLQQSAQGNELAQLILSATSALTPASLELTPAQTLSLIHLMDTILNPNHGNDEEKSTLTSINQQLLKSRENADPLAQEILKVNETIHTFVHERTRDFIQKVSNPSALPTAASQMQYTKLVEKLALASEGGNTAAGNLLTLVREGATEQTIQQVFSILSQATAQSDPLAMYITSTLYALSPELKSSVTHLYQTLIKEKESGNQLAIILLKQLLKGTKDQKQNSTRGIRLPKVNRLQQVTLDDYEAVKKLWIENYTNAEVPLDDQHHPQSREAWIQHDIEEITDVINLLSSSDQERVQEGMNRVGSILPFLLLGGFTLTEINGYLKAKLEAAKQVLSTLSAQHVDVEVDVKPVVQQKEQHMENNGEAAQTQELMQKSEEEEKP